MSDSLFDRISFEILAMLTDNQDGLRFKEFKARLPASDPVISRRLSLLKKHGLVQVKPVMEEETESKYFVYQITDEGMKFAKDAAIDRVLKAVKERDSAKRSK